MGWVQGLNRFLNLAPIEHDQNPKDDRRDCPANYPGEDPSGLFRLSRWANTKLDFGPFIGDSPEFMAFGNTIQRSSDQAMNSARLAFGPADQVGDYLCQVASVNDHNGAEVGVKAICRQLLKIIDVLERVEQRVVKTSSLLD